jgi:hypothetical protein
MSAEESELYPVLRQAIEDGLSLMRDAEKEHSEARGLLAELARLEEGTFEMDAKVATLRGAIAHHVKDEEDEIFPKAELALSGDRLNELGARIARAKRSAPEGPSRSAVKNSPGASVTGVASAAVDRVRSALAGPAPKRARRSSSTKRQSKRGPSARSKKRAQAKKVRAKVTAARAKRR